ncbi:hypothetical protein H4582DRAFT_2089199 [Lactarius indigo]|nr:hypothetical protein H4582DRAFT_2089199 [Lactarius indigo]
MVAISARVGLQDFDRQYGGNYVTNLSGGPEARGTTGLEMHKVQAYASPPFDVLDARRKYGLVYDIGLEDPVVVSPLSRPEFYHANGLDGRDR